MRVKDAIVDQFRARHGDRRPSVDARAPDVRVNAHLARGRVTISLDLSGDSLHRRGYRTDRVQVEAPLKENLAAAMLLFAAWPQEAAAGGSFIDPLCGSGTLPIEAALIAADIAPGLLRAEMPGGFGFQRWLGHDDAKWHELVAEARQRKAAGLSRLKAAAPGLTIMGRDHDPRAVPVAQACAKRAGLSAVVDIAPGELAGLRAPAARGLLAANAPVRRAARPARGGRGRHAAARREAARRLLRLARHRPHRQPAAGGDWSACRSGATPRSTTARSSARWPSSTSTTTARRPAPRAAQAAARAAARDARAAVRTSAAQACGGRRRGRRTTRPAGGRRLRAGARPRPARRLAGARRHARRRRGAVRQPPRKNQRRLGKQLRREGITCYRLYDADLPDYNLVVDVYGDWVHVQEYAPPAEIDPAKVRRRLEDALGVICAVLDVPAGARGAQGAPPPARDGAVRAARRRAASSSTSSEDDLAYLVNLHDYLDTGFFVDQRLTRRLVRTLAGGRRFLNLFAYTGTMTVNALAGGSPSSTTVDLSGTYLDWARRNLEANGFAARGRDAGARRPAATASAQPGDRGRRRRRRRTASCAPTASVAGRGGAASTTSSGSTRRRSPTRSGWAARPSTCSATTPT